MEVTNPDFISLVEDVVSAEDIWSRVGEALSFQNMFERRTSPWEMSDWEDDDLQNFCVSLKDIDRLYHLYHLDDGVSDREFELLARMDHKGRSVYVKFIAGCDFTGFECQGGGEIYVSFDAQVFLKSIVSQNWNPHGIWKSMVNDGLDVEEPTDFDFQSHWQWNNVPMLKFLGHMAVYNQQHKLRHYNDVLPIPLADSITEFLKVRETREHHDFGF